MALIPFRSNLARQQNYDPMRSFRSEFDKLFDDFFTQLPTVNRDGALPLADIRIDVSETPTEIRVRAELPGVEEKDIDVELTRDTLTVRGEKKFEKEENERDYHLVESSYGSFSRSIRLPFQAKAEDVEASFKNGLLSLTVKKPEQKQESTKITLKSE